MKDLIIGASTNYDWDKLKYWINSINESGFEGDKALIDTIADPFIVDPKNDFICNFEITSGKTSKRNFHTRC